MAPVRGTARLLLMLWIAHVRRRPGRFLMSVAVLAVGVALALAVNLVNHSALGEFRSSLSRISGQADLSLYARSGTLDDTVYERLLGDPAVAAASPVIAFDAEATTRDGTTADGLRLPVLAIDPLRAATVTPALLGRGAGPLSLFETDAVFLSAAAARATGMHTGDTLVLRSGPHTQALTVAGSLPGIGDGQRLAVIDLATAQWRFGWSGRLERIDLRLAEGADPADLQSRWNRMLPHAGWRTPAHADTRMASVSRAYRVNLTMLAMVALLTGLFLVHANLALAARRQAPEHALLVTLGASRTTVAVAMLGHGLAIGLGGAVLGCALGIGLARLALATIGGDLGAGLLRADTVALSISPWMLAGAAALGVAAGVAGSLVPALRARDVAPTQALRVIPDQNPRSPGADRLALVAMVLGAGALALPPVAELPLGAYAAIGLWLLAVASRAGSLVAAAIGVVARRPSTGWPRPAVWLALARMRERPGEATVALAGVVASMALAAAMAIMVHSFRDSLGHWLDQVLPAEIHARLSDTTPVSGIDPALGVEIRAVDGVRSVEWTRVQPIDLDPQRPAVTVLARDLHGSDAELGIPLVGPVLAATAGCTRVFGSEALADIYGWKTGARVALPFGPPGHCFVVGGIWRDYARQHGAIILARDAWQALTGDALASDLSVRLAPEADPAAVLARLEGLSGLAGQLQWRLTRQIREISLTVFDRSFAATYALEAIAIVLGLLGVAAGYAAEALARQREFGVLQHLGMRRSQISMMLAAEAAVLVGIGALIGLALGTVIAMVLILQVNPVSFHWRMEVSWPLALLACTSLALVAMAALVAALIARQAMQRPAARVVRADW